MPKNTVDRSQKQKQKVKLGCPKICDCKTNFSKSIFTRKYRIEIYRKSTFRNFWETYVTPQYLEKVSKFVKDFQSLTLYRPQSINCLVCVRIAVKNGAGEGEGGAFLLMEAILFSRSYYMMSDMAPVVEKL